MNHLMNLYEKQQLRQIKEMREPKDTDFTSIPLDEPAFFEAVTDDQGERKIRHGPAKWSEFKDWLNLEGSYKFPEISEAVKKHRFSLRLIHIPLGKSWDRVNMTRENWEDLQSAFELHSSTVEAVVDLTGAFGLYTYRAADSSCAVERIKIVIKVANKITIGYDALSLVFDLKTMTMRAMIHGLMPPQWSELLGQLCNAPHLCCHPLFLPVLVFVNHRRHIERYRAHIDKSIHELEQETGFGASGFLVTAYNAGSARRDFVIESALVRLQSQQTELATLASVSRYSERLADFLVDAMTKLDGVLSLPEHTAIIEAEDEVAHLLGLARSQAQSVVSVVQALKERVQSQTNLIFSLISSEENRISRLVAEESAKVAISSKRDSMAMKTVAVLTMIFLPGTFVAAFLSMPLFEWNADTGGYPSSTPFHWVYWVITLPLTITLMIGWRLWWTHEDKAWRLELEQAEAQNRYGRTSSRQSSGTSSSRASVASGVSGMSRERGRWGDLRLRDLVARGR